MRDADPTPSEQTFFEELSARIPGLQDWYNEDSDGTPWILVSCDFVVDNVVTATLRTDYDGKNLRGGWGPSFLNWDDGVRATDAHIDTTPPDGLSVDDIDPAPAAEVAAQWFADHIIRRTAANRA
jgi:hypothetical protein